MATSRIILAHGNGEGNVADEIWYPWLERAWTVTVRAFDGFFGC